ncbi:MAG: sigma-70 family RNA polymerase sigma factor [Bacteroidetes bacterium]|nr:sigma-70 family RNA polymerase sigma factor [Bacteroidota bacterium]MBU1484663.1 sigma-70 family RNA polymerase sigma factor [Bacteroidota bacterium]MBU1759362.1 sigma-70 family RNA polymerase sigma factor [Bacteroidota bacterium]MBU2377441.1 sigma-70 family RNA polymerase sigma factor [Bacteroidota bacterium]
MILKLISLYAYSIDDRNDLYQEVLLNAWKSIHSFQGKSKFSTWLYQVALNTILTFNRKNKKPINYSDTMEDLIVPVAPQSEKREDIQRLHQAIRQLNETDRVIITLNLEGYENPEIADILGITPNYIGVKLFRIKNQLQTLLKQI